MTSRSGLNTTTKHFSGLSQHRQMTNLEVFTYFYPEYENYTKYQKTYFDNEPNHTEQRKIFNLLYIYLNSCLIIL